MTGGNYDGAFKVGEIKYKAGENPIVFSELSIRGSSVQIQGGDAFLQLAEVQVYALGKSIWVILMIVFLLFRMSSYSIIIHDCD